MSAYANYDELVMAIHNSGRDYDMKTIEQAYLLANEAHGDQVRKSGEPYIVHPISVALILVELGIAAADTDDTIRMLPAQTVDQGAVFPIRHSGDGAGIDDINITVFLRKIMPQCQKHLLHGLRLILIYLATQCVTLKFHNFLLKKRFQFS